MSALNDIVELLSTYVDDAVPVAELEIRQFAKDNRLLLRDDHVKFLTRFGCKPGGRPQVFKRYEADFDFGMLKRIHLENSSEMETPAGHAYFGSSFVGDSFCVEYESGKIYAYDDGQRFGVVHESIAGFLLDILVSIYGDRAFDTKVVSRDMESAPFDEFRSINRKCQIFEANCYEIACQDIHSPKATSEFFLIDGKLIVLYPPSRSKVVLSGGILNTLQLS